MEQKNQNQKNKHVPIRTCIGTGEKRPKKELIRIVNVKSEDAEGNITENLQVDLKDKLNGRGANLLPEVRALDLAIKKKKLEFSFKRKIRSEEIEYLREAFPKAIEEKNFRPNNRPVIVKIKKSDLPNI